VLSQLTPEQFTQPLSGNHGSIRNTMVHVLSAEWDWLSRCGGPERGAPLDPLNFPTVASLVDTWNQVEGWVRAFLSTLRDEDLARNVEFVIGGTEKRSMPMGELLQHAANHGVHHRGQVSLLLLRLLGSNPDNFDFLFLVCREAPPAGVVGRTTPPAARERAARERWARFEQAWAVLPQREASLSLSVR
jgi:uncharacterized damage-inducible protein DinB